MPTIVKVTLLNEDQIKDFLSAAQDSRYRNIYRLTLSIGLPKGELLGLLWTDLDLDDREINLQRSLFNRQYKIPKFRQLSDGKGQLGQRIIHITQSESNIFEDQYIFQEEEKQFAGSTWHDYGLVFTDESGRPIKTSDLYRDFTGILKKAKLPEMDFQALRDTAAVIMLEHGTNASIVQNRLGHSSLYWMLDKYGPYVKYEKLPRVSRKGIPYRPGSDISY